MAEKNLVEQISELEERKNAWLRKIVKEQGILENNESKALRRAQEVLKNAWQSAHLEQSLRTG